MSQTSYIVFQKNGSGYEKVGTIQAATPKAAIAALVDTRAKESGDALTGTFAATPVRNWAELPVGVEVVTRVKVG